MKGYKLEEFEHMMSLHGKDIYVQMPNSIFKLLSNNIETYRHTSFAYSFLVLNAFLYKYTGFVNFDLGTYTQNNDIKQILGYSKDTKSVNYIIKDGGLLDSMGLTKTTKDIPIVSGLSYEENESGFRDRDFIFLDELIEDESDAVKDVNKVIKNRNYKIKLPLFLFEYDDDLGTLYNYENTHRIYLKEFINLIYDEEVNTMGFTFYSYLKSLCFGLPKNKRDVAFEKMNRDLGICSRTYNKYSKVLEGKKYFSVERNSWSQYGGKPNVYRFIGL